jgi:hypothetical protein
MSTLELAQHPEFAPLVAFIRRHGDQVDILDRGQSVLHCSIPSPKSLRDRLADLHASFTSPVYPGNSVVDERRESR